MIPVQSRHVRLTCYLTWNIGLARTTKRMAANYHFLNRYCSPITSLLFILHGRRQRSGRKERDIYTIYKHETFSFSPSLFTLVVCMFVLRFDDASQVSGVFKTWGGGGWVSYLGRGSAPPPPPLRRSLVQPIEMWSATFWIFQQRHLLLTDSLMSL